MFISNLFFLQIVDDNRESKSVGLYYVINDVNKLYLFLKYMNIKIMSIDQITN